MTWLDRLRDLVKWHRSELQLSGAVVTFVAAMAWVPMWVAIMRKVDMLMIAHFGVGLDWIDWGMLGVSIAARLWAWIAYDFLDADNNNFGGRR